MRWLDTFIQPITINHYWDEDAEFMPDTFRESDKRYDHGIYPRFCDVCVRSTSYADIHSFQPNAPRIGSKLLTYHGLDALNTTAFPTWDSFFTTLLEQPETVIKITTPSEVGRRAYSDFDIDIEPARLCARILSVREQLAREMVGDLEAISNMGQLIFDSYWENSKKRKTQTTEGSTSGNEDETAPCGFDHPSTMYIAFDPLDDNAFAPSPLHKGKFLSSDHVL